MAVSQLPFLGLPLLYSDNAFDPFVEHLGLHSAMAENREAIASLASRDR
jgi:hypothetical protein